LRFSKYMNKILLQNSFELKNLIKVLLKSRNISSRLLMIINVTLQKIYPSFVQSKLSLKDLEWSLWPEILMFFGMYT